MKKITCILIFLLSILFLELVSINKINAQSSLWCMTRFGGSDNVGVIFQYDPASDNYSKKLDFVGENGDSPLGGLMQASNGLLYGTTSYGGSNNKGVIFQYDPLEGTYSIIHDFNGTNGRTPFSNLIQASNGLLYGMTWEGGSNDYGVIFHYDPVNAVYTKIHDFDGINGKAGHGDLLEASDGFLYGMTFGGGSGDNGTIFQYDPVNDIFTKIHDFDNTNGRHPMGSLIQATNGLFYGVAREGSSGNYGIIFQYDLATSTFTKLHSFSQWNYAPRGSLMQASDGMLYGTVFDGGTYNKGAIFKFNPVSNTYTRIYNLGGFNGEFPTGSLMQASDGLLYGMARYGGINGLGVIFKYDIVTSNYYKIHDFTQVDGAQPYQGIFIELSACPNPSDQLAQNVTASSAELGWTENGVSNSWELMLGQTGFDTTGLSPMATTNNPYNATGLSANTDYDWYIRSVCGSGIYSSWMEPVTFQTTYGITYMFIDSGQELGSSGSTDVALGDLNGNGNLDAVVINDNYKQLSKVWFNDGAGNFVDSGLNFGSDISRGLALGDLNGDGNLDGFVVNNGPNKVYLNKGNIFTNNGQTLGNTSDHDAALADLDGDGDMDAVVVSEAAGQPNKLWLNDGNGNFSAFDMDFGEALSSGIALGDLDSDGDIDGFIVNIGPNKVYLNAGPLTSDNGQQLGDASGKDVQLGDIDGDGDLDAVIANDGANQPNAVWLNNGNGDFSNSGLDLGSSQSMGLAIGDLDSDGDLDGFVANNGPNRVYLNNGANTTDNGEEMGTANSHAVALGDLDGDGDLDAFVANYDGPDKVWLNQSSTGKSTSAFVQTPEINRMQLTCYPNPFNNSTTIAFSVSEAGRTIIRTFNSFGQEVKVLYDEHTEANRKYEVTFSGLGLPQGLYICRMQSGNSYHENRMVLAR